MAVVDPSFVRLYEGVNQTDLAFKFEPEIDYDEKIGNGYLRLIMPISLQSVDINLPRVSPEFDPLRFVKIWQVFGNDTLASTESGFYNMYTEPDWARRTNSAKYKLLIEVAAGEHVVANISDVVRRIFIECRL
jgi:hypothetical protein